MLLQTLALSTSFIFGGLLNGYKRFAGYAPLLYGLQPNHRWLTLQSL